MRFGKMVDAYLTTPASFRDNYQVSEFPNFKTKAAQEYRDECKKRGVVLITEADLKKLQTIHAAVEDSDDGLAFLGGDFQVPMARVVKVTGPQGEAFIPVKGLPDSLIRVADEQTRSWDLKISNDLGEAGLVKTVKMFGYHWQEVLYRLLSETSGFPMVGFDFLFIEDKPPYKVATISFDGGVLESARKQVDKTFAAVYEYAHGRPAESFNKRRFELSLSTRPAFSTWDITSDWEINKDITVEW